MNVNVGGSAWESNPPGTVLAPHTGFEVRELHQTAAHFRFNRIGNGSPGMRPKYYNHCLICQYLSPITTKDTKIHED
jgi:hypothetical protein